MRLAWGRKTIENPSNVLGITRWANQEIVGPISEYKIQYNQKCF